MGKKAIRRQTVAGRRESGTAYSLKYRHRSMQLLVSGAVFVLLVGVKLLLPEQLEKISSPLSAALEKNMDVAEVFSAVSRGFSGRNENFGDSWDDLYAAVFGSDGIETERIVSVIRRDPLTDMRAFADGTMGIYGWLPVHKDTDSEEDGEGEAKWIGYQMMDYPANTEPEQVVLGFEYLVPVCGTVSSGFGYRENPVEDGERFHYGIDLAADADTPITAFADGVVTVTGESSSYGKYLILSHDNGCTTLYAHCSEITAVSGECVSKGERIAVIGETGQATGLHLHFELQKDGVYLNPIYYVA